MDSGLHEIDHYLDDFLFAGADKTSNCSKLMNALKPSVLIITTVLSKDEY
jgi:hypothetical protein